MAKIQIEPLPKRQRWKIAKMIARWEPVGEAPWEMSVSPLSPPSEADDPADVD